MAQLTPYNQADYSGGLNNSESSENIAQDEASLLRNWDITEAGKLTQRAGLTQVGDTISNSFISGLHSYRRTNGGKDLLMMEKTNLRYLNANTWTVLDSGFTTDLPTWFETCPINDKVYITNGTDALHSWDRASTSLNACLTSLATTVPRGKVLRWHKNHMFTVNAVKESSDVYRKRVYWSNLGDPDTWTPATNFFDVPGEGNSITVADMGDSLVVFNEHSIQFLSGWGSTSWIITASSSNVANLDEQVGCIAPRGVTKVGNEVWFVDDEGFIRRIYQTDFDAYRRDVISTKLNGTFSGINKSQLAKAVAFTWNDKVFFAIPNGSSTVNSLVLVYDLNASKRKGGAEAWTTYTGWTPAMIETHIPASTIEMYIGDASVGKVYQHTGKDDAGVPIDCRWDGKNYDYGTPNWKRFKWGDAEAPNMGDTDVDVYASMDSSPFSKLTTINLQGSGSKLGPTGTFLLGPTGIAKTAGNENVNSRYYFTTGGGTASAKRVRMSIRHNDGEEAEINNFINYFKSHSIR
jgi:hypothetical protein